MCFNWNILEYFIVKITHEINLSLSSKKELRIVKDFYTFLTNFIISLENGHVSRIY